jgi:hypothetical protein
MAMQSLHIFFIRFCHKNILNIVTMGFIGIGLAYAWGLGNLLSFFPMGVVTFFICWATAGFLIKNELKNEYI